MRDLLFLAHRIPYPPDKGDKIRAWHIFRHLARTHRIHLGCFIDDPADRQHLAALRRALRRSCLPADSIRACSGSRHCCGCAAAAAVARLFPAIGDCSAGSMPSWRAAGSTTSIVFSSAMAPYVDACARRATAHPRHGRRRFRESGPPMPRPHASRHARSGHAKAARCWPSNAWPPRVSTTACSSPSMNGSAFVDAGAGDRRSAPAGYRNGVDLDHFSPRASTSSRRSPARARSWYSPARMDYRPNIDAVQWFAREVLPVLRRAVPSARFWIVGAAPTGEVRALGELPGVQVTGRVPTRGLISPLPTSWWHRCGSLAASRTRCWRRWRWRDRWSPRRRLSKACVRSPGAISCWQAALMKRFKGSPRCSTADMQHWARPRDAPSKPRINGRPHCARSTGCSVVTPAGAGPARICRHERPDARRGGPRRCLAQRRRHRHRRRPARTRACCSTARSSRQSRLDSTRPPTTTASW